MRAVQFNSLSADAREQFVGATDEGSPHQLAAFRTKQRTGPSRQVSALSIAGGLASIVGLIAALSHGFASAQNAGQAGVGFLALYGMFFFTLTYSLVSYLKNRVRKPLPFATGTYLFTSDVVIATPDGMLMIYPLADAKVELHQVNPREGERFSHLVLSYADTKLLFVEEDEALASHKFERIQALQSQPEPTDTGFSAQSVSDEAPSASSMNLGFRQTLALSLGVALLAVPTWYARNHLSDGALFTRIQSSDDLQMMHRYALESNSANAPAARDQWMEAQFQGANESGGSLVSLIASYPEFGEGRYGERIRDRRFELAQEQGRLALASFTEAYPEHAAGASALLALEVAHARRLNTVAVYRAFIANYPDAPASEDFRRVVLRRYATAEAAAAAAPEKTREILGALITFLQANESTELSVRFSPPRLYESTSIDRRHRHDSRSDQYERITPHMAAARARIREEWVIDELNERLGRHYPNDVFEAKYEGQGLTPTRGPTLDIHYQLVPYGLVAEIETHVFERFHFDFEVTLQVPGQESYDLALRTDPLDESAVVSDPDYPQPAFYDDAARRALQQLARRIVEEIFGQDYERPGPLLEPAEL